MLQPKVCAYHIIVLEVVFFNATLMEDAVDTSACCVSTTRDDVHLSIDVKVKKTKGPTVHLL